MPIAYPYRMSDWYGYDKDCTSLTSFSMTNAGYAMTGSAHGACLYLDGLTTYTYYHDGSGSTPVAGDTCYSDSAGNTPVNRSGAEWTGNASGTLYQWNANSGVLQAVIACPAVTAFNTTGVARNACSFSSSDRTFYHDGSGTYPTTGDTVYSNSAGTTKVSGGERRWFLTNGNGGGVYTVNFAPIGGSNTGIVGSVDICII